MEEKNLGNEYYKKGKNSKAIDAYTRGINRLSKPDAVDPDSVLPVLLANRSQVYIDEKQYKAALNDATRSISLQPNYGKSYFRRGIAHARLRMYTEAAIDFDQARTLSPDDAVAIATEAKAMFQDLELAQK
eukprot:PhF_6_TR33817/c0_g1_i1/m.49592